MSATPLAMQSFQNKHTFNSAAGSSSPFGAPAGNTVGNMQKPQSTGSPYLPGYLLGNSPQVGNQTRSMSSSGYSGSSMQTKWNSRSPPHQAMPYSSPLDHRHQRTSPQRASPLSNIHSSLKDKPGAPPTESLFSPTKAYENNMETESPVKPNIFQSPASKMMGLSASYNSPVKSSQHRNIFSPCEDLIPQSPAQVDPFYTQGERISSSDTLDDTAVTVFGFPTAASTYILQQFTQYGHIEKHEIHNTGNWLHIKYKTKIQAKKALSRNGKVFSRTIMVGVLPCIKKEIAEMESNVNATLSNNNTAAQTPDKRPPSLRSLSTTVSNNSGGTPIRNLSVGTVLTNDRGTPQKQNSVVTKALDYVFGW